MARPRKADGYTPIANEIMEALMQVNLSSYEWRFLLFLWRKTYGWRQKKDKIPLTQFVKATGIRKQHISRVKQRLLLRKIVTQTGYLLGFNKNYHQWCTPDGVTSLGVKVTNLGYEKLPKLGPSKEKKETIKRKIYIKEQVKKLAKKKGYPL